MDGIQPIDIRGYALQFCDTEPVAIEGIRSLLESARRGGCASSPTEEPRYSKALSAVRALGIPSILLVDKAILGIHAGDGLAADAATRRTHPDGKWLVWVGKLDLRAGGAAVPPGPVRAGRWKVLRKKTRYGSTWVLAVPSEQLPRAENWIGRHDLLPDNRFGRFGAGPFNR